MYGCEIWTIKKAEHLLSNGGARKDTTGLSQGLDSPLDSKEMKQQVNPKGNQPSKFTGRTDAEAGAPILWPLNTKS